MYGSREGLELKELLTFEDNGGEFRGAKGREENTYEGTTLMIGGVQFHNSSALREKGKGDVFVISFCRLNCSGGQNTARQIDGFVCD